MYECDTCCRREYELDEADTGEAVRRLGISGRLETVRVNLCPAPDCDGVMWDLEREQF